jgi:hypothetical protein
MVKEFKTIINRGYQNNIRNFQDTNDQIKCRNIHLLIIHKSSFLDRINIISFIVAYSFIVIINSFKYKFSIILIIIGKIIIIIVTIHILIIFTVQLHYYHQNLKNLNHHHLKFSSIFFFQLLVFLNVIPNYQQLLPIFLIFIYLLNFNFPLFNHLHIQHIHILLPLNYLKVDSFNKKLIIYIVVIL